MGNFSELIDLKKIQLKTVLKECSIIANPYLLDILLNNVIHNAIKHNFEGGSLFLCLKNNKLILINSGVSLYKNANQYFNRFEKGNQKSPSTGLGLAIVKEICKKENFNITYKNNQQEHKVEILF